MVAKAEAFRQVAVTDIFLVERYTYSAIVLDCKTVVFFANASDGVGPSSNERSRASVKTARENGERR